MVLLVLLKGQAGHVMDVSGLVHNRPETVRFFLRGFATKLIGLINGFSIALCCLFAGKAQASLFFTGRQMSFGVHGHAPTVRLGITSRQLNRDPSASRFPLQHSGANNVQRCLCALCSHLPSYRKIVPSASVLS